MIAEFVKTGNDTSCSMKADVNSSLATYKTLHYEVRTFSSLFIFTLNDWPDRLIMYHKETEDHKQLVNVSQSVTSALNKVVILSRSINLINVTASSFHNFSAQSLFFFTFKKKLQALHGRFGPKFNRAITVISSP
jgi:hypothetical protein